MAFIMMMGCVNTVIHYFHKFNLIKMKKFILASFFIFAVTMGSSYLQQVSHSEDELAGYYPGNGSEKDCNYGAAKCFV